MSDDMEDPDNLRRELEEEEREKRTSIRETYAVDKADVLITHLQKNVFPSRVTDPEENRTDRLSLTLSKLNKNEISLILQVGIVIDLNKQADSFIDRRLKEIGWENDKSVKDLKDTYTASLVQLVDDKLELNVSEHGEGRKENERILTGSSSQPKRKHRYLPW